MKLPRVAQIAKQNEGCRLLLRGGPCIFTAGHEPARLASSYLAVLHACIICDYCIYRPAAILSMAPGMIVTIFCQATSGLAIWLQLSLLKPCIKTEVHAHDISHRDDRKTLARAQGVKLARGKHSTSLAGWTMTTCMHGHTDIFIQIRHPQHTILYTQCLPNLPIKAGMLKHCSTTILCRCNSSKFFAVRYLIAREAMQFSAVEDKPLRLIQSVAERDSTATVQRPKRAVELVKKSAGNSILGGSSFWLQ